VRLSSTTLLKHDQKVLYEANSNFIQTLRKYTLQDIIKNRVELTQILLQK
jgi:hypothetical protein